MAIKNKAEIETKKIDEKIKKLQEEKLKLADKIKEEEQKNNLAHKVGLIILDKYKGKNFKYDDFHKLLEQTLVNDFERNFFGFSPLAEDDPRRPKRRGRKKSL
ncbi:hypothetical protein LJC41_01370 [Desulfosarcina sp. OttesenSCG-928-G17]|nr:hypothetical protein [Desulfosarcina sp. OttesenSCG-928-G17]